MLSFSFKMVEYTSTISKCQNFMWMLGDAVLPAPKNSETFLPESKLKVSLRFAGIRRLLEIAFSWFCFHVLVRLKFVIAEKLILLTSLVGK